MTTTVTLKGMLGVEHARADGGFAIYEPGEPVPPRIKAGDRLRLHLEVAGAAWLYAVSVTRQGVYRRLGAWAPPHGGSGVHVPWPGGHVLTDEQAEMETLIVIASSEDLPWASDLVRVDCSAVMDRMPPKPPVTVCDHLYGLFWKVPPRPRGMIPPDVDMFEDAGARIPAIVVAHRGAPYTAVEWQFKPRA
ncbi:MAG TPA: hypothetical protein VFK02_05100 [Kofleriaceae bacterium]|nr:hypothetical protein [Kofleriaceae bacterium]